MSEPVKELLQREDIQPISLILDEYSKAIEEIVNFGSQILAWDLDALDGNEHDITASMMFRQYLELIDSISILIRRSSTDACKAILRNALEISTIAGVQYPH